VRTIHRAALLAAAVFALALLPATAQDMSRNAPSAPPGIIVPGRATVHVAPDAMHVQIRFFARANATGINDAGQTVATTMRANGIPDARWVLPLTGSLSSNTQGAVIGTIRKPTREGVEALLRRIVSALPASLDSVVSNFQISSTLTADDCSSAEARAQSAAMADAKARAGRVAAASGLRLGRIVNVYEGAYYPSPGCNGGDTATNAFRPQEDQFGPLDIPLTVSAVVTFALR
jgi:uncharacterized protein YggE